MQIAEIITVSDYIRALMEIRCLIASEPDRGTPDGDRLDALICLAETFEAQRYALDPADIEAR
jgi:antitoxin component HigA of HigAB toxin-antitoxin module